MQRWEWGMVSPGTGPFTLEGLRAKVCNISKFLIEFVSRSAFLTGQFDALGHRVMETFAGVSGVLGKSNR